MQGFNVRRPLCLLALVFAAGLFILGRIRPPDLNTLRWARAGLDGQEITITATAAEKEFHRSADGTLSLYLIVRDVSFSHGTGSGKTGFGEAASKEETGSNGESSKEANSDVSGSGKVRSNKCCSESNVSDPASDGQNSGIPDRILVVLPEEESDGELSPESYDRLIQAGDRLRVRGTCRTFEEPRNPGGFNSALYFEIQNISFKITSADILSADRTHHTIRDSLYNSVYTVRRQLEKAMEETYPPEAESIVKAMLLGENGQLDGDIKSLYQGAGIIHILSVSGLHISLLGMAILRLLRKFYIPEPAAAAASSIVLCLYALMTGLSPSSLRALFMFCLRIIAGSVHRTYDLLNATSVVACLLLADKPLYLYHSGFLFSFSAILSIAILLPACKGRIMKSAAVPLGTLPVYLHFYYTFPLYSLLLNLIVIPLMTVVMYSAVLSAILYFISPVFGEIAALPARGILAFYKLLCETVQQLPFYTLNLGCPQAWQTAGYFLMIGIWLILNRRETNPAGSGRIRIQKISHAGLQGMFRKLFRAVLQGIIQKPNTGLRDPFRRGLCEKCLQNLPKVLKSAVLLFAVMLITFRFHTDELRIDFLDVGQGDGICIEKGDTDILIDGGSSSSQMVGKYVLQPYFQYYGLSEIDDLILTHDDIDHCSGVIELLENMPANGISIGQLLLPDISESLKGEHYRTLEKLAQRKDVPVKYISRGSRLVLGSENGVTVDCIYPAKDIQAESTNEASLVLLVRYGRFIALLTGDLEKEGEADCLKDMKEGNLIDELPDGALTILKAGHHGSGNATSEELLDYLDPKAAVISCGRHNLYGHPAQETLDRLENAGSSIFRTDEHGMIRVTTDGNTCRIREYARSYEQCGFGE